MDIEMQNRDVVEKVVRETLSEHFDDIRIQKIFIDEDFDTEGDRILRINVIFLGSPRDLDVLKLAGTTRLLRPKLDAIHESAMPLLSFISKADYDSRAAR